MSGNCHSYLDYLEEKRLVNGLMIANGYRRFCKFVEVTLGGDLPMNSPMVYVFCNYFPLYGTT